LFKLRNLLTFRTYATRSLGAGWLEVFGGIFGVFFWMNAHELFWGFQALVMEPEGS